MSLTVRPGGKLCFSLSAFSRSFTQSVYRYLLQRTLNFTTSLDFLILTAAQRARSTSERAASDRPTSDRGAQSPRASRRGTASYPASRSSPGSAPVPGRRRTFGVLPPRRQQEVLDLGDLLRLPRTERRGETQSGPDRPGRHPIPWPTTRRFGGPSLPWLASRRRRWGDLHRTMRSLKDVEHGGVLSRASISLYMR